MPGFGATGSLSVVAFVEVISSGVAVVPFWPNSKDSISLRVAAHSDLFINVEFFHFGIMS